MNDECAQHLEHAFGTRLWLLMFCADLVQPLGVVRTGFLVVPVATAIIIHNTFIVRETLAAAVKPVAVA